MLLAVTQKVVLCQTMRRANAAPAKHASRLCVRIIMPAFHRLQGAQHRRERWRQTPDVRMCKRGPPATEKLRSVLTMNHGWGSGRSWHCHTRERLDRRL